MQLQSKFHVYLDYLGYMIDPKSYRVQPAALLGSKFSSGRAAYASLDFWQMSAMTDWTHGMNQKYLVDPSAVYYSLGLDLVKPGEFRLERDLSAFTMPATPGVVTARYKATSGLYIGTSTGKVYKTTDGLTFAAETIATTTQIYNFFEIDGKLFLTTGSGKIYCYRDSAWVDTAYGVEMTGRITNTDTYVPTTARKIYGAESYAQTFKVGESSTGYNNIGLYSQKLGVPGDLIVKIYMDKENKPDEDNLVSTLTITAASGLTSAGWMSIDVSNVELNSGITYWMVFSSASGDTGNCWMLYYTSGQRATLASGKVWELGGEAFTNTSGGFYEIREDNWRAQAFEVPATKTYYKIKMRLGFTNADAVEDYTLAIHADLAGVPNTSSMIENAEFTITPAMAKIAIDWVEVESKVGFKLEAGVQYWLVGRSVSTVAAYDPYKIYQTSSYTAGTVRAADTVKYASRLYIKTTNSDNPAKWESTITYGVGEIVDYSGGRYECILISTGKLPTNIAYWVQKAGNLPSDPIYWTQTVDLTTNYWKLDAATGSDASYSKLSAYSSSGGGSWTTQTTVDYPFMVLEGDQWRERPYEDFAFRWRRVADTGLYFVMTDSDYAFGWFYDGVRRSVDGYNWLPEPPDPLWVLPSSEGTVQNAIAIPKGFLAGSIRALWIFIGGSSGIKLWNFPDYQSTTNFAGMDCWANYGIFGIDGLGLYFTDGSQIYPTNLISVGEAFPCKYIKSVYTSGSDIFALVSNDNSTWYLARCNLTYQKVPQYWWLVKQLSKAPAYLAGWNNQKLYVFYADQTAETYNKDGNYQASGYTITSLIDENLVKLLKQYNSISTILASFPTNTEITTSYRHSVDGAFINKSFTADGTTLEHIFALFNPTLSNRIQIKTTLTSYDVTKTPIVSDVIWKYTLERPLEDPNLKLAFGFTVLAADGLEDASRNLDTEGVTKTFKSRMDIINQVRASSNKKQALNYIGADNISKAAIKFGYVGTGTTADITIDRTNYVITTRVNGANDKVVIYKDLTLAQVASAFDAYADYTASCLTDDPDCLSTRTANDLEPRYQMDIKGEVYLMAGTDVHSIIVVPQSPTQQKMTIDGRGEDRVSISLRET